MKKQLLCTSAIALGVAAGGLAALMAVPATAQDAEFGLTGFARMGGAYQDDTKNFDAEYRLQLDAKFKVVADVGLVFGGKIRMRGEEELGDQGFNSPVLYVETGDLKLSVGNINGVIFNTPPAWVGTGLDGNAYSGTAVYFSGAQSVAALEYDSNGMGADDGIQLDYGFAGSEMSVMNTDNSSGVSVRYSQGGLAIGAAYQQNYVTGDDDTLTVVGATYAIDALTLGAAYAVADVAAKAGEGTKWSVNGTYAFNDALRAKAFFASENNGAGDGESYGLSVSRAIGGGVTAIAGWEQDAGNVNYYSAGVSMGF